MKLFTLKSFCVLVFILLLPAGCGKKTPVNTTWVDEAYYDRFFENVFVVGAAARITTRNIFEESTVSGLQRAGIGAIPSGAVLPYTNLLTREDVVTAVERYGTDCLLIVSLIGRRERGRGNLVYESLKDANPYNYFSGLNSEITEQVKTEDVGASSGEFFLKATLYDAASEKLVWSLTSMDAFQQYPKSLNAAAKLIVRKLRQDGLI